MRDALRAAIFLFCSLGLIALGAACPGGQITFGDYATQEQTEGTDVLVANTEAIDLILSDGGEPTIDIPCDDIEQIVSREVTVRSLATANFVDVEEEIVDYGDGNCGLNYLPLEHNGLRWRGEPVACDRYLMDARIEMQAYRAADTINSKAATLDETRILTSSMQFNTPCPNSIEMDDSMGTRQSMALVSDDVVSRLYFASDSQPVVDVYVKRLDAFDNRSIDASHLSTRLSVSSEENRSVDLLSIDGVLIDMTYENNQCHVDAFEGVTGARLWSKTLSDDSVDSYECVGATAEIAEILEEVYLAEWGANPRYYIRILNISNGAEIARYMVNPDDFGMETLVAVKPGPNSTRLILASDGDFNYLMKATLGDEVTMKAVVTDTDYTLIKDFATIDSYIYTLEDVFDEDIGDTVATLIRRNANGDALVQTELDAIEGDGLDADEFISVGDHVYVTANNSDYAVIAKVLKKNMTVEWARYVPFANFNSLAIDVISGDISIMGVKLDLRVTTPMLYRLSVYGHHFGDVFVDDLDALKVIIGEGGEVIPECPPESEICIGPLTH